MNNKTPLWLALAACFGLLIGFLLTTGNKTTQTSIALPGDTSFSKLNEVLNLINNAYVDTVDHNKMVEDLIPSVLKELDPHSSYIPKDEVEEVNADLDGSFSGIGVQFMIQNDTIMIVDVIAGGPSEKMGILPGDRIIEVNDSNFTGKTINNNKVMKNLRGTKNTQVKLGIKRKSVNKTLYFTITRGDIPVNSIDIAYPITPQTGYIKISKFGANTYTEFLTELMLLREQGCQKYIIDLRNNSGGYLYAAILMINELLPKGELIVYTEGQSYPREEAVADGSGRFTQDQLCILINEWSASASEIMAGAIQDQDRGLILGRRSFGKGLVQQQIPLKDGSEVRLTIARYYTPSGRCIQKPYEMGKTDDYETDIINRFNHGEFFAQDSINLNDSLQFTTRLGRTVYGGGGIMPDIFIAQDTTGYTPYYNQVFNSSILYDFCFQYSDQHRKEFKQFTHWQDLQKHLIQNTSYLNDFYAFATTKGVKPNAAQQKTSEKLMTNLLQALIVRNILGDKGFYPILNQQDETVLKAVELISQENFPVACPLP